MQSLIQGPQSLEQQELQGDIVANYSDPYFIKSIRDEHVVFAKGKIQEFLGIRDPFPFRKYFNKDASV